MTKYFKIFTYGLLISFLGSLPLGTLNVTAFQISSSQSLDAAILFALAVVIVELIAVRLTLIGLEKMSVSENLSIYLYPLGIALLFYLAISNFLALKDPIELNTNRASFFSIQSPFLLGVLLSVLNPLQIPFWLGWNRFLMLKNILNAKKGIWSLYMFGIGLGTLISLLVFIYAGTYIFKNYQQYNYVIIFVLGVIYLGFSIYLMILFYKKHLKSKDLKLLFYRIIHWEFWPMKVIYYPLFPVWLFYAVKARSFFFFNAANPSMKNGGMAMESKKEIYDIIPSQYIPKTVLITQDQTIERIETRHVKCKH